MISVDDVAALVVVADRHPKFSHNLDTRHIDIKWILSRDTDGSSPSRFRQPGDLPKSPMQDDATQSEGKPIAALPPLRLSDLDFKVKADEVSPQQLLITTPRSALVVLKLGLGVRDLLATPEAEVRNKALLDGIGEEEIKIRVASEDERRKNRRDAVNRLYQSVCGGVSSDELTEAIRSHYFSAHRQDQKNVVALQRMRSLTPAGKLDLTLMDDECAEVVHRGREKTTADVRRVLLQSQRQQQLRLQKEAEVIEKQKALEGENAASNVHRERILKREAEERARKREHAEHRATELLREANLKAEQKRSAIIDRRAEAESRVEQRRLLARVSNDTLHKDYEEHRAAVKAREEALLLERRQKVEQAAAEREEIHSLVFGSVNEERRRRKRMKEEEFKRQREEIQTLAEREEERRRRQSEEMAEKARQRQLDVEAQRAARIEVKRARAEERKRRGAIAKQRCEEQKEQRLREVEEELHHKAAFAQELEEKRKADAKIRRERSNQIRIDRSDERSRCKSAAEFHYVGYMSSNVEKTSWMEREHEKRHALATHIRQEREALSRAQQQALCEMDEEEGRERRALLVASLSKSSSEHSGKAKSPTK